MVTSIYLGGIQVLGIPGCRNWAGIVEMVEPADNIIVVLDPDAEFPADKLTNTIGNRAIRLTIPTKPDDAFISGMLNAKLFWQLVKRNGRRGKS
jgi:hypothetical protein